MKALQLRNLPDDLYRRLKLRVAEEGISMSEYVLRELGRSLEQPSRREILARLAALPVRRLRPEPAEILRQARAGR